MVIYLVPHIQGENLTEADAGQSGICSDEDFTLIEEGLWKMYSQYIKEEVMYEEQI